MVLKTEKQGESQVQHYIEPRENSLLGTKEDELTVYSQDEVRFLREAVTNIKHRTDGMIEVPLALKTDDPAFESNSAAAYHRTRNPLETMQKKF